MKSFLLTATGCLALAGVLPASNLYYMGEDAQESLPLKWAVGADLIWDDNVTPTIPIGFPGYEDDVFAINPYVEVAWVNITPQTTIDLYARLGVIYYFDEPAAFGSDDTYLDAKIGFNLTHRFSERLRYVTRNFFSYQLEPDYTYGYANSRLSDPYFYWSTDHAIGYRWTERLATYTGFKFTQLDYDSVVSSQDRDIWMVYHDFRYQLSQQTVLTAGYRYSETDAGGLASDSTNQYALLGVEHRFSPNTIMIARGGAQFREVDAVGGEDTTSPYAELLFRTRVNEQFVVRSFARYGIEDYDTVFGGGVPPFFGPVEFDNRAVFRLGVSGQYFLSPNVSLLGGVDYINSQYDDGRLLGTPLPVFASADEDILNLWVGVEVKITEWLYGTARYNYTDSSSDIFGRDYDRNRVSVGMRAEF